MSIVCDTGFINIVDPFLNPDSTVWTGSITYTLQYATTVAGATLVEARQVINVSDGIDICLAPGLYTVVYNQSGQRLPVTSQWTVPPTGGPYTIADLEGVGPVTGSLTVTGPFIAMSTVTMTSLINAAARPYVATDSVGLLSTGNLALIAISGSASDLASGTVAAARGGAGTLTGILKANGAGVVSAATAGTDYAVATNGTIGQALTSNGTGGFSTALTLATVATSGSASDLTAGTLAAARMPAITGDVTTTVGTVAATVVKINGTTLSALATGLLKNTTATGVPSIAVAGTDLIGGVGNLTTVGSVPYVSASGILNQDAGQLHWDATNNRLGIGTNAPGNTLTVVGSGAVIRTTGTNDTSAVYSQFNSSASTGLGYAGVEGSTPGATLTGTLAYATFISAGSSGSALQLGTPGGIRATILASGNVGIGTTTPAQTLHVKSASNEIFSDATTGDATLSTGLAGVRKWSMYNQSAGNNLLIYDWTNSVSRVTVQPGTATAMTILASGNVGIGTTTPAATLTVINTGATAQVRFGITAQTDFGELYRSDSLGLFVSSSVASAGAKPITFATGSAVGDRMVTISGNGNVLIGGTTDGNYRLDVQKSGSSGTFRAYDQTATTGSTLAAFRAGIAQSTNPVLTVNNNANTVVFSVNSGGAVVAAGGIYNSISSATGFGFNQYVNGLGLAYGSPISWADNGIGIGSYDIGIIRAGVGLLEINSGTIGTLRDLKRRFDAFAVSTVASATTVALTTGVTHITGTTTIATITAPTNFSIAGGGGCVTLIPDGLFVTNTAGNIAIATVAVISKALIMCYDNATLKWYPSY